MSRSRLAAVDTMFASSEAIQNELRQLGGFENADFMVTAESTAGGLSVTRAFHFHGRASFTIVGIRGPLDAPLARCLARELTRFGYRRRWRMADEVGFERMLTTSRAQVAELAFLERLDLCEQLRLRSRAPLAADKVRPRTTPLAKLPRPSEFAALWSVVRGTRLSWNVVAATFSHRIVLRRKAPIVIEVSGIAFVYRRAPSVISVCLNLPRVNAKKAWSSVVETVEPILARRGYSRAVERKFGLLSSLRQRSGRAAAEECATVVADLEKALQ